MSEDVLDRVEIKQMNDYAMSKWVNEMQILNSATHYEYRVRPRALVQHLRPGRALQPVPIGDLPVLLSHAARHSDPSVPRLQANQHLHHRHGEDAGEHQRKFKPGEVYNIGGDDYHTIEEVADIVLRLTGKQKQRKKLVKVPATRC